MAALPGARFKSHRSIHSNLEGELLEFFKRIWSFLKRIEKALRPYAKKVGNFQARVLLTVLYAIFVLPFGVLARLFSDPLRIKKRPVEWINTPEEAMDMQWAKRQ